MTGQSTCKYCGAVIRWATTEAGKAMPLNPEPDARGNQELLAHGGGDRVRGAGPSTPDHRRYKPHWATCPGANKARRR